MTEQAEPAVPAKVDRWGREDGFTPRQRAFIDEYLIDMNATQAAIRAGYSAKSAGYTGHDLLQNYKIVDAIAAAMAKRSEKTNINRSWVLTKLVKVHDEAVEIPGLGALDRRLKAIELIGRHVDVRAWRTNGLAGMGDSPSSPWDLTVLDDEELEQFERLLAKISTDRPYEGGPGREDSADDPSGPGEDEPRP